MLISHHPLFLRWKPEEVGGWRGGGTFLRNNLNKFTLLLILFILAKGAGGVEAGLFCRIT